MKKLSRILILSLLIIITLSTIIVLSQKTNNINIYEYRANSNSMISMMLQDEKGNYVESENLPWPGDGYTFNSKLSKCTNGSKLKYNELENTINVETAKTDKCYAYFDNKNFIEDLSGNGNHGANRGAIWQSDGLLLGDENEYYGYINCGLVKHDFKNNVSFVIKYIPKSTGIAHLISNHEGAGLALFTSGSSLRYSLFISELATYRELRIDNSITVGNIYTIVGTYDGYEIKLYVNGNNVGSMETEGNIRPSSSFIAIGGNPMTIDSVDAGFAHILLKETLIFDRALTAEEIARDYANEINPTNKDDMLLWYKF